MTVAKTCGSGRWIVNRRLGTGWCAWHTVKYCSRGARGLVILGSVSFPPQWIGKKVLFQINNYDDKWRKE